MRKFLSLVIVITMLFSCFPVHALEMIDLANAQDEAALREAVRGDELWVANFPNGLFNFVGTQYVVNEGNDFLEIAIARQGGTAGDVSVDLKAIDVSAEYGVDYVIRVYENSARMEMKKNENAIPLIDTLENNPELNISEPSEGSEKEQINDSEMSADNGKESADEAGKMTDETVEPVNDGEEAADDAEVLGEEPIEGSEEDPEKELEETPAEEPEEKAGEKLEENTDEAADAKSTDNEGLLEDSESDASEPGSDISEPESDISEPGSEISGAESDISVPESDINEPEPGTSEAELDINKSDNTKGPDDGPTEINTDENKQNPDEEQEYIDLEPKMVEIGDNNRPKSLKELREIALGHKSTRPDWKEVNLNTIEQLKASYDEFFYNVLGTETIINFKDGEYIKYLYIVPLNDDISESEEQILFALTNPTGGAVRGEFYMAYANIQDDDEFEASRFEFAEDYVVAENGKASVVIRRTTGIEQYASVYIGTEAGTAIPDADYVPGLQELFFTPGMTEQIVIVNLLENSNRLKDREFTIALDRKNKNVNLEKAEVTVIIPIESNSISKLNFGMTFPLFAMAGTMETFQMTGMNQMSLSAPEPILPVKTGMMGQPAELGKIVTPCADWNNYIKPLKPIIIEKPKPIKKLSQYGSSPAKGKWDVVADDFLYGTKKGTAFGEGTHLRLQANGGVSNAKATNVKLYGVDSVSFGLVNNGCGHHWTTYTTEYKNGWDRFWKVNGWQKPHYHEEHNFNIVFTIEGIGTNVSDTYWGNCGYEPKSYKTPSTVWNNSWIGFGTWAAASNQSTAYFTPVTLNLNEYTIKVLNDINNVPEFELSKYELKNDSLNKTEYWLKSQPGKMEIRSVDSQVNNSQKQPNKAQTGIYRSDIIDFNISYTNNEIGSSSIYEGFDVKIGNRWKRYSGTTFSFDDLFFQEFGAIAELSDKIIEIRPVFSQKEASVKLEADTENGYITGFENQKTSAMKFSGLYIGDIINVTARNHIASTTPSWSANNQSAIVSTDATDANISVDYKLTTQNNWLRVDFVNPTLIVKANPNVYVYNVSKPTYKIDSVTYTDMQLLRDRMAEIYKVNSDSNPDNNINPDISLTFNYVFDSNYPDKDNIKKSAFGTPQKAVLTVYKSDGSIRAIYPSVKDQNSPANYNVTAKDGVFTYIGKLNELGWEDGDYATAIIYGSKKIGELLPSTRENVIDFLTTSGNAITVKTPDERILGGDVYNPITIEKADPVKDYEMTSYLVPGYVAKWKDYSGDLDGDGQVSDQEYLKLERKMQSYGMNLDNILKQPAYKELFWGNFFNYIPRFFNPSRVLYNFEKAPIGSTQWTAWLIIKEKFRTVLDPYTESEPKPVANATVIVGNKPFITDEYGIVTITDPMFQEGNYYLARVTHKGYEFYTYVQPGSTVGHIFDTSDRMRPFDFKAKYYKYKKDGSLSEPEVITLNNANTLIPVKNGLTEFNFRVNSGMEGLAANNAIIRIYETNEQGYRTKVVYEKQTEGPINGVFTHSLNLLEEKIKPGNRMTISPLYMRDGKVEKEYPEVDVGLSFSMDLKLISALASFDTPFTTTLQFIGQLNNSFDLGMDIELDSILKRGTRVDDNGVSHNTKYISFGFNKEFEKKFGDQKDDEVENKKVTDKLKGEVDSKAGAGEKGKTQNAVKDNTKGVQDAKKTSAGGTFNYDFSISLILTIEEGEKIVDGVSNKDGFHYFSSMILMAEGNASFDAKATYVTPIGIPVFATINISGSASAIFGIEANDSERYVAKYKFDGEGRIPISLYDYSVYTKFFVSPSITIGAGVGFDFLKLWIEGNVVFNLNFTVPIVGNSTASEGSGGLVMSAAVGIKILFIQKKWTIYKSKEINLFQYGNASQAMMASLNDPYSNYLYEPVTTISEDDIMPRDYLENSSGWLPGKQSRLFAASNLSGMNETTETKLIESAYPYPQTKIVPFGNGKVLVLFINDPGKDESGNFIRDSLNRAQLFYTIYDGNTCTWTEPVPVDNDNTWDEAPDAFVIDDRILVTWADAGRVFTTEDTAITTLSAMNISARWFDMADKEFKEPEIAITKYTEDYDKENILQPFDDFADINPMISYDHRIGRLLVYYTKIDYKKPQNNDEIVTDPVYGDITNGYNTIAFRYADRQEDGSFLWNTTYDPSLYYPVDEFMIAGRFTPENFYGQRLLDLSVLVDIQEREVEKNSIDQTEDEAGKPEEWKKTVIGTEQIVTAAVNANTDPLVIDSDLITYNGLALYSYAMDSDGNKSTTNDQELYMQIYNYEKKEFHHPIRLTNNNVQDTKPQFVRTKDITYLYWIYGGDIVYMDITNLVKYNLKKEVVEIDEEVDSEIVSKFISMYIVDKSYTGINGYITTAVGSRPDYPIEDFRIQSNGESEYLIWTDYVISYKNGLKAGDPGTEDLNNINKERQIFAAYHEPQVGYTAEQVFDYYNDIDGELSYVYLEGKDVGTYPIGARALKNVEDENGKILISAGDIVTIDYKTIPDINGYKGVVKAGDPVTLQKYESSDGYVWSKPIQLTNGAGENYSDISFIVSNDDNIRAVYIKYNQKLDLNTGSFVEDASERIFASNVFNVASTVKANEILFSEELPLGGRTLNFTVTIENTGAKPITELKYVAFMKQNGEQKEVSEVRDILSDGTVLQSSETNEKKSFILGGDAVELFGAFELPEDITNLSIGFRILDKDENVLLETEKAIRAEANLDIAVINSTLTSKNAAELSLYVSNTGNLKYDGKLDITNKSNSSILKSLDLSLNPGEGQSLNPELAINSSMFGEVETAEDGSVYDKIELELRAGEYSRNAEIKRAAGKSVVDTVKNVKSFSTDRGYLTLYKGTSWRLITNTVLNTPIPEYTADPMQIKWKTSNADVASVLPDGTVLGFSNGSAVITATLLPKDETITTLEDGSIASVDTSYKLPASMVQEKSVIVTVYGDSESEDETDDTSNTNTGNIGGSTQDPVQQGETEKPGETKQSDEAIAIEITPEIDGQTSTITPSESTITDALQKLKEENKSTLTFAASSEDDNENDDIMVSELVITSDVLSAIADSEASTVVFETPFSSMVLERQTIDRLNELAKQVSGNGESPNITIQISRVDAEKCPDDLKKLIGNMPVYDFSIMVGDKNLGDITGAPVPLTLELGNMPKEDLSINENQIVGVYITEDGKYKLIPLSALVNGKLVIKTTHNSLYGGLYNNVQFEDVSGWSEDFIAFLSARGVINGKGNNRFDPKNNITRGEFVKMMAMIAAVDTSKFVKSSFKDVDANKWYAPYIEWAYTVGLVNGVGNGLYEPDKNITREDMAVLIHRFSGKLGYDLPGLKEENLFKDNSDIAKYASDSVKTVQKAGIIEGKPNGIFAPKDNATREEAAKVLTVLIKLIVGDRHDS